MTNKQNKKCHTAQETIVQDRLSNMTVNGRGDSITIGLMGIDGGGTIYLHDLAIMQLQEIISDYENLCEYLEIEPVNPTKMWADMLNLPDETRTLH